jgi:hypothetical protein
MATLSELQAYRASLMKARGSAVREVQDAAGNRVVYKSDAELETAIAAVDREIAQLGTPIRTVYLTTAKGT